MGACGSKGDDGSSTDISAMNEAELSNIKVRVMRKLMKHSIRSSSSGFSRQHISVVEEGGTVDSFYHKEVSVSKGPFGILGKGENCPVFGCNYDIDQINTFDIYNFNTNITGEDINILNDIESQMQQQAETSLADTSSGLDAANTAISASREIVRENILNILNNISTKDFLSDQSLVIEYNNPPRCKDPCGLEGGPFGPKLNQLAQMQIYSEDIINSSMKIYEENLESHGLDVVQSISTSNDACILQMIAFIICSMICLILIWKLI
jgi:hypothetical protein